jgi:AhpC/TSA family
MMRSTLAPIKQVESPLEIIRRVLFWNRSRLVMLPILISLQLPETVLQVGADERIESPLKTRIRDISGRVANPFTESTNDWKVFVFFSIDCPIANRAVPEIRRLKAKFEPKGVQFWLVNPNVDEKPEAIRRHAIEFGLGESILLDPGHELVRACHATVTPEAAVFATNKRLLYNGRIDNRTEALGKMRPEATEHDLESVLDALLEGRPPTKGYSTPVGCRIPE